MVNNITILVNYRQEQIHRSGAVANRQFGEKCSMASPPNTIRHYRERAQLTQEELAAKAGTTAQQISRLEKGERKLSQAWMKKLAPPLGVRPADLLELPEIEAEDVSDLQNLPSGVLLMRLWAKMSPDTQNAFLAMALAFAKGMSKTAELDDVGGSHSRPSRKHKGRTTS